LIGVSRGNIPTVWGLKPFDAVTPESILDGGVPELPALSQLRQAEKDDPIRALWAQVQSLMGRVAALEGRLGEPSKTPDNSGLPPSKDQKPNQPKQAKHIGARPSVDQPSSRRNCNREAGGTCVLPSGPGRCGSRTC